MSEMTAAEAREAADWHRGRSSDALFAADDDEPEAQRAGIRRIAEMHDRAAVALDAYADGIDAAAVEREACANAQGMERLAITMWRETEDAARSSARGDAEPPRNVSTDPGIDLFLTVKRALADAEARGRQHGALAIAWRIVDAERNNRACVLPDDKPDGWWKTRADAFANVIVAIEKLAAEATDGPA